MGPMFYIGTGGAFTSFHEDGVGAVDSVHLNITGCNEVIILRRLTGEQREHASQILKFTLNQMPRNSKCTWATNKQIEELKKYG